MTETLNNSPEICPADKLYDRLGEELAARVIALPEDTEYTYNPAHPGGYVNLDGEDLVAHPSPVGIFGADQVRVICLSRVNPGEDNGRGVKEQVSEHPSVTVFIELDKDGAPHLPYPVNPLNGYKHPANSFLSPVESQSYEVITRPNRPPVIVNMTWERPVAQSFYDALSPENTANQAIEYGAAHELTDEEATELLRIVTSAATCDAQ